MCGFGKGIKFLGVASAIAVVVVVVKSGGVLWVGSSGEY